MGRDFRRLTTCPAIRQAYEQKLIQAYGGVLPPGYATLPCEQLTGTVEKAQAVQAEAKAQARAQAAEMAKQRQTAQAGRGFLDSWGVSSNAATPLFGQAFYLGLLVHGLLAGWALVHASRMSKTGEWIHLIAAVAGLFTRAFEIKMTAAHILLFAAGIWFTNWTWGVGALLAIVAARILAVPLWAFGFFRNPLVRRTGVVDPVGNVIQPPAPPPKGEDKGRTEGW